MKSGISLNQLYLIHFKKKTQQMLIKINIIKYLKKLFRLPLFKELLVLLGESPFRQLDFRTQCQRLSNLEDIRKMILTFWVL